MGPGRIKPNQWPMAKLLGIPYLVGKISRSNGFISGCLGRLSEKRKGSEKTQPFHRRTLQPPPPFSLGWEASGIGATSLSGTFGQEKREARFDRFLETAKI